MGANQGLTQDRTLGRTRSDQGLQLLLRRWSSFTRFLDDGRICLSNNAAERALRGIAICGSFCPCWAGGRDPLSLASVFRVPFSLRVQRRALRSPSSSRLGMSLPLRPG
ncbi:MAG: hypothetical protein E5Y85_09515 [Mesorhizobium sp.]|nr:MAG: hypothetical protein E5Y85_09515 [Mesorhizobium sp.]TIM48605.1 MAG: hypothetical protein E5Y56_06530 [Mesorhizobium sp.]